jgi:hypothetical protein
MYSNVGVSISINTRLPVSTGDSKARDRLDSTPLTVVPETNHHVVQTAVGLVDPILGRELRVVVVRVLLESLRVDNLLWELAPDHKRVAHNVPLPLGTEEAHQLAQVVDQPRDLHPVRFAVPTDSLGCLEQVLNLPHGGVRVGLVNEGVEHLHRGPHRHPGVLLLEELCPCGEVPLESLLAVLLLNRESVYVNETG